MKHRFHVVSLPHTQTTDAYSSCAFTQKVVRFCDMMTQLGHEVFLYSGVENTAPCTAHIPCIPEDRRRAMVGGKHFVEADWGHHYWPVFNAKVVESMGGLLQPRDFICLIGGWAHKPIADAFPSHISVEFGIGYPATFAKFRVFESYAWMHTVYGADSHGNAGSIDGRWFDTVIPNQIDERLYEGVSPVNPQTPPYVAYLGRNIERKGVQLARDVCQTAGIRLECAGPGFYREVGPHERTRFLAGATALLAPTHYIEPFGTVTIEAMAAGTPVITSDWGAFTETVENGVDGFRCRMFGQFVNALKTVPSLDRYKIATRARQRFGMKRVAHQYDDYFEQLSTLWGKGFYEVDQ